MYTHVFDSAIEYHRCFGLLRAMPQDPNSDCFRVDVVCSRVFCFRPHHFHMLMLAYCPPCSTHCYRWLSVALQLWPPLSQLMRCEVLYCLCHSCWAHSSSSQRIARDSPWSIPTWLTVTVDFMTAGRSTKRSAIILFDRYVHSVDSAQKGDDSLRVVRSATVGNT